MIPKRFTDFYGDESRWFLGSVVDIHDPLEIGRIKVRIYGVHPDDQSSLSDDDLPWAQVIVPVNQGGTAYLGNPLGVKPDSLVFGFFLDGNNSQNPIILGSIPKFEDEETPVNPLARGIQSKPYTPDAVIGEPSDPFAAKYPDNLVYETSAGHVKEYDNTLDAERIRELHKSGTFYQVSPDGDLVTHVVRDRYTVIASNDAIHVTGNVTVVINGNAQTQIDGNWNVDVKGDIAINGKTINLNRGTQGAARIGDTADTGDEGTGSHFDVNSAGTNVIETGSGTVFIGD